jgi:hypothetical protein
MFTWVCPTCGRELDLATKECPDCAGRPSRPALPARRPISNLRFWAVVGGVTALAVAGLVIWSRHRAAQPAAPAGPRVELDRPAEPPPPPRLIEVSGIRMAYDARHRPQARAVIVNHGEEPLAPGTSIRVALRPSQASADSPPLGYFTIKLDAALPAGDSREVRAPLDALATLAAMPPWHQLRADIE